MFLATNLVDTIDDAVMGRVSIHYTYEPLGAVARSAIWEALNSKFHGDLSHAQVQMLAQEKLNGRQVC